MVMKVKVVFGIGYFSLSIDTKGAVECELLRKRCCAVFVIAAIVTAVVVVDDVVDDEFVPSPPTPTPNEMRAYHHNIHLAVDGMSPLTVTGNSARGC
jgi:hypothetical protein